MVVTSRGVLPPAKYNYADTAWFKYILSCTAATTAELGEALHAGNHISFGLMGTT